MSEVSKHHILFYEAQHMTMKSTRQLRTNPSLIVPMDEEIHQALHRRVVCVPPLDVYTAQNTVREFRAQSTYTGSMLMLMTSIEKATQHFKTTRIQKQLAELAVYAIEQQLPYVRQGAVTNEVGGYRA